MLSHLSHASRRTVAAAFVDASGANGNENGRQVIAVPVMLVKKLDQAAANGGRDGA